ncbi:MAG: hypothetical protein LRS46_02730 [Desulfurococcales archaeon]|nr:hypothetical protein [Desulfurococcales archaeon]
MRARILVVASPTIDIVGASRRPGGPGLYAAATASFMGCRVEVLGPLGLEGAHVVAEAYRLFGAELLGPLAPGCPYVFHHSYTPEGSRASLILCRPPPLGPEALGYARGGYDALQVSPVGCEVPPAMAPLLASAIGAGVSAIDLQGYERCWGLRPPLHGYALIHASTDDTQTPPDPPPAGAIVYTMGARGGVIITRRGSRSLPKPPRLHPDPTGAGDILVTATLCIHLTEGVDLEDSVVKAVSYVPDILDHINNVIPSPRADG